MAVDLRSCRPATGGDRRRADLDCKSEAVVDPEAVGGDDLDHLADALFGLGVRRAPATVSRRRP